MRERGTGSIGKRGKIWWVAYYVRGRRVRESTGETDERKAQKFLKRRLAEVVTGTFIDAGSIRYEDLRAAYFLDYAANRRKTVKRDADGNFSAAQVKRLDGYFTGFKADEIDAAQVKRFASQQQERGLSNASINLSVSALRRMFNIARREGKLRHLPYFPMLKASPPRKGFFDRAEYEALSAALPDYARLPLALGYFTGMRKGEALGLRWDQVDFLRNTITLHAGETKNDEGRVVPVVPQLSTLLRDRYAKRQAACPYVCWRLDKHGDAVRIKGLRKVWESRCVKLGLGKFEPQTDAGTGEPVYRRPRCDRKRAKPTVKLKYIGRIFHDLRRSAVRNMVNSGVPEKVAMTISGHKTRSVFDRYNIVSDAELAVAARKIAEHYESENGHNSDTTAGQGDRADLPVF